MENRYGVTIAGVLAGSSALHAKSSEGLHAFGSSPAVVDLIELLLVSPPDVQEYLKIAIL